MELHGNGLTNIRVSPFSNRQFLDFLDSFKLKEFTDDNFKFDENGRESFQNGKKTLREKEKLLVASNFSFFRGVFIQKICTAEM